MSLIRLTFILILLISKCRTLKNSDPDIDLCQDFELSGSVVAEDDHTYIFKGQYYWNVGTIGSFKSSKQSLKIDGFANLTTTKWPEITDEIEFVFTISLNSSLTTVFVLKNNKWFAYQNGINIKDGSVDNWPEFKNLKVTASITQKFGGTSIFVLHSGNYKYILYDFEDIENPTIVRSGKATIQQNVITFFEYSDIPGTPIRDLIDLKTSLTYEKSQFFISRDSYCEMNLQIESLERRCKPIKGLHNLFRLFGCPLDIKNRPTTIITTTTSTTTTTTTKPTTESKITDSSQTEMSTQMDTRTGLAIVGGNVDDLDSDMSPTANPEAINSSQSKNRENTEFWIIIVIGITIGTSFLAIISVGGVLAVKRDKRPKGDEIYL